jgi:ABC-type transport system involved in multi-copper enzyme maturation permease subunit
MKFFAILRDSLRETLDVKLFYVMVGLSLLVVLFVGSVTYRPVSVQQQIEFIGRILNAGLAAQMASRPETQNMTLRFDFENFQQHGHESEPWLADYSFDYVVTVAPRDPTQTMTPKEREGLAEIKKELHKELNTERLEQQYRQMFTEVKVEEVPSDNPDQVRFHVTTSKGTLIKSRQEWIHEPRLFFGLVPIPIPIFSLNDIINFIGDRVVGTWGAAFTMLISTIITAFFLPNMLAKGTVDLLLSKPIHRTTLFLYKFLGGLLFMFLNTTIIMVGVWLALGIQSGMWINALLLCVFIFTFQFAIFYAVSALIAVLTRSAIVSILAVMMTWGLLVILGWTHWIFIEQQRNGPPSTTKHWAFVGYDVLHTVLPRYKDIDWLTSKMIKEELLRPPHQEPPDPSDHAAVVAYERRQKRLDDVYKTQQEKLQKEYGSYDWTSSLTVSAAFIAVMLGLACWRFATRDY